MTRVAVGLSCFAVLCAVSLVVAGEFEGLTPGVSRKADADRVLGPPVREVVPGTRFDYDPARHDARRISIKYDGDKQVIETIDLYFKTSYAKSQYQQWFKLEAPARTAFDGDGNLIEYYSPAGLALHYDGPDDQSPVEFFSHFDQEAPAVEPSRVAAAAAPVATPVPSAAPPRSYLGVLLVTHDGQGVRVFAIAADSAASRAGLQANDVLLELGSTGLYETGTPAQRFGAMAGALPPGRPVRLLVQRGPSRFETTLIPEDMRIVRQGADQARAAHEQGRQRMAAGDLAGAAAAFEQAVAFEPREPAHYAALGETHYRRGDLPGTIRALQRGIAAAPSYRLYVLLGFNCREAERYDEAIDAFFKVAALMPAGAKDIAVFEQLGFSLMKKRRYADALRAFETAFQINPRSPDALYFLGGCHDVLGNPSQAISFYSAYLEVGHDNLDWNRYARRRLELLTKNPQGGSDTTEELLKMLDELIDAATSGE